VSGGPLIRAFGATEHHEERNARAVTRWTTARFNEESASHWLVFMMQILGVSCTGIVLAFAIVQHLELSGQAEGDSLQEVSGLLGLALSYSLSISGRLNNFCNSLLQTEINLVAVERAHEYSTSLPSEKAEPTVALAAANTSSSLATEALVAPSSWPREGEVRFESVMLRYRPELPHVLKGVSFTFAGGESVGVVGRSGSGKSTLTTALLRLAEVESGRILIDSVDLATLSLERLRSSLGVVMQSPILWTGTLRENLDPKGAFDDEQICRALVEVQLAPSAPVAAEMLELEVGESGDNWSAGQRQTICMARALLRRNRVIILDEATSSIDHEADAAVQRLLRSSFKHATIIAIAHRLETILDYDKVLVMHAGEVAEFGEPEALAATPTSRLAALLASEIGQPTG